MRTSVEITAEQHLALTSLATQRGIRGFSPLIQEALDLYLSDLGREGVEALLALEGSLSDEDVREVERRIAEAWSTWSTAS